MCQHESRYHQRQHQVQVNLRIKSVKIQGLRVLNTQMSHVNCSADITKERYLVKLYEDMQSCSIIKSNILLPFMLRRCGAGNRCPEGVIHDSLTSE